MKLNSMLFVLAAAAFLAVGANAQDPAPDQGQTTPAAAPQTAPQTKEQKKAAWENGVRQDCSAEIAEGGVCAGKDFTTGLEKCLHQNRKKLSDACKATIRPRHHKSGKTGGTTQAPAAAPSEAPAQAPTTTP